MSDNIELIGNTHKVIVESRKSINLTGIKKIISFDEDEFLLETTMGSMLIKGKNLEMTKLDTAEGIVNIKGNINGYNYFDGKSRENSIFSKLFK